MYIYVYDLYIYIYIRIYIYHIWYTEPLVFSLYRLLMGGGSAQAMPKETQTWPCRQLAAVVVESSFTSVGPPRTGSKYPMFLVSGPKDH